MKKKIVILGSTGSIGRSTLEVIRKDKTLNVVAPNKFVKDVIENDFFNGKIIEIDGGLII